MQAYRGFKSLPFRHSPSTGCSPPRHDCSRAEKCRPRCGCWGLLGIPALPVYPTALLVLPAVCPPHHATDSVGIRIGKDSLICFRKAPWPPSRGIRISKHTRGRRCSGIWLVYFDSGQIGADDLFESFFTIGESHPEDPRISNPDIPYFDLGSGRRSEMKLAPECPLQFGRIGRFIRTRAPGQKQHRHQDQSSNCHCKMLCRSSDWNFLITQGSV